MKPHCAFCCAHPGWIVVGMEHTMGHVMHRNGRPADCPGCYEQLGPCPFCEKGKELEHTVWGSDGFWKGISPKPSDVDETCHCSERRLPREANLTRITELKEMVKNHLASTKPKTEERVPVVSGAVKLGDTMPAELQAQSRNGEQAEDEIGTLL